MLRRFFFSSRSFSSSDMILRVSPSGFFRNRIPFGARIAVRVFGLHRGIDRHHRHRVERLEIEHHHVLPDAPARLKDSCTFKFFGIGKTL